ncbi:MAG: RHS repeat-associated core domain-containing protein [Planctomycetota bacterium]
MEAERVATYEYDGLFRRIEKDIDNQGTGVVHNSDNGGSQTGIQAGDRHEHYYYTGWRLIETTDHETGGEPTDPYSYDDSAVLNQFVYGTMYIDEPLIYDRNLDADEDDYCVETGDARYFYHQDANFRVVMLTDEDGDVVERTRYTAYGEPTVYGGEDSNGDELGSAMLVSSVGNPFMHQALFRDRETRTYQNRERQYHSASGRFYQRDPAEYVDGLGLYTYTDSNPNVRSDPSGQTYVCCSRDGTSKWVNCKDNPILCEAEACCHNLPPSRRRNSGRARGPGGDPIEWQKTEEKVSRRKGVRKIILTSPAVRAEAGHGAGATHHGAGSCVSRPESACGASASVSQRR